MFTVVACTRYWLFLSPVMEPLLDSATLTTQDAVMQAFLLRKLKIGGSMGMALKLQPILDAAQPKSKM